MSDLNILIWISWLKQVNENRMLSFMSLKKMMKSDIKATLFFSFLCGFTVQTFVELDCCDIIWIILQFVACQSVNIRCQNMNIGHFASSDDEFLSMQADLDI